MNIVCLDLEGVLLPEIWIAFAKKTGIEELKKTTKDEPNYDKLMAYRLSILNKHNFKLKDIQNVVENLEPLDGAKEFVSWVTSKTRLVILSDTFDEFIKPLMNKIENPTLFCHSLKINNSGYIENYSLRIKDHKKKAVEYFKKLNFKTFAAGDSYNDLSMIDEADYGSLFCPPQNLISERPDLNVANTYAELQSILKDLI